MLLGRGDELLLELLVIAGEALVVGVGELDGVEVGDDGATLTHDGGPVVHGPADRAGDLDGLDLGLEGTREDAVDGTLEPVFDPVEQTHRAPPPLWSGPDRIRIDWTDRSCTPQVGGTDRWPHLTENGASGAGLAKSGAVRHNWPSTREWRNGRRAGFRCQCPKGRGGSNPPSRTRDDDNARTLRGSGVVCMRDGVASVGCPGLHAEGPLQKASSGHEHRLKTRQRPAIGVEWSRTACRHVWTRNRPKPRNARSLATAWPRRRRPRSARASRIHGSVWGTLLGMTLDSVWALRLDHPPAPLAQLVPEPP